MASRVQGARRQQQQITELQEKVSALEGSLTVVVQEFEEERRRMREESECKVEEAR